MNNFMLLGIFDWIGEFFKSLFDFIPKIIYLLYASLACLLDVFQLALRKLAGLDVYYDAAGNKISGDIVTNFIAGILGINFSGNKAKFDYSALSTVFWALVVFGVIITFVSVFVALIKSHYNYDEKAAKGPMQYVYAGLKAILNIAIVPVIVVLGLYVSQAVLTAVDSITAGSTAAQLDDFNKANLKGTRTSRSTAENSQNSGETTYIYYDIFGTNCAIEYGSLGNFNLGFIDWWADWDEEELASTSASTQTFSGVLFRAAAYNANRARKGEISYKSQGYENIYGLENGGIFSTAKNDDKTKRDKDQMLADMIDTAFVCNLHLSNDYLHSSEHNSVKYEWDGNATIVNMAGSWTSAKYFTTFFVRRIPAFSKFNIGAVWYYYDLWQFNFIVGFGAVIVCVSLFINIILGLMTRIFMCLGLFLIAPPLFGLGPVDGGKATKSWTENFMKQVLMAYGAIIGMNIFFLIFPLINQIRFFNIDTADAFMTTLIIIVGLISIKAFISVVSGLVGGEDANKTGEGMKEEVGQTMGKALKMTAGAALMPRTLYHQARALKNGFDAKRAGKAEQRASLLAQEAESRNAQRDNLMNQAFSGEMTEAEFRSAAAAQGLNSTQINEMWNATQNADSIEQARSAYASSGADSDYNANRTIARDQRQTERYFANQKAQAQAKQKRRLKKASAGGFGSGPLAFVKDGMLGDKGLKGFTDSIWKPRDFAKETADNTAAMRDQMGEINSGMSQLNSGVGNLNSNTVVSGRRVRRDMNQGFTDVTASVDRGTHVAQTGFRNVEGRIDDSIRTNRAGFRQVSGKIDAGTEVARTGFESQLNETKDMHRDMNTGFTGVTGSVNEMKKGIHKDMEDANKHLDEIQQHTADIKETADQQEQELQKLNTKAKRVIDQNARESRRLGSIMKSAKETNETVKKISKKM